MFNVAMITKHGRTPMAGDKFKIPLTNAAGAIIEEPLDGGLKCIVPCARYAVYRWENEDWTTYVVADSFSELYITNSRVIVRCERYNKNRSRQEGWWESNNISMLLDFGQFLRNNRERRGNSLIGHLRYEWVNVLGYKEESPFERGLIRFIISDSDATSVCLDAYPLRGIRVSFLADNLLRRIAHYRLSMTDQKSQEAISTLQDYATGNVKISEPEIKKISTIRIPGSYLFPQGHMHIPKSL